MKNSRLKIAVLEKEPEPARHTSGRNSGVMHSGINPKPKTLKAQFCVEGNARLRAFNKEHNLPMEICGTLVVAQDDKEIPILEELMRRGNANGTPDLKIIDGNELRRREPHAKGIAALLSPSGGIASGKEVTKTLAKEAQAKGVQFLFDQRVVEGENRNGRIYLKTNKSAFTAGYLINCAGLYADEVAHLFGVGMDFSIVPFRGEYYKIRSEKNGLLNSMLYPVPDLRYPFLGVHWTKMVTGEVMIGPNAIMAFGRESYDLFKINIPESLKMISQAGFWKMFAKPEFRETARQQLMISMSKSRFIEEARKLVPDAKDEDFVVGKRGNRAQLVDKNGNLVDDLVVEKAPNQLHVLNAISPGFTCSLPFADYLAGMV